MTRLKRSFGIATSAVALALAMTAAPAEATVTVFKNSYVGNFATQQTCEENRELNTVPGDPSVVTFPCFFASSSAQLSLAPQDWRGPGWYYRVRTSLD